MPGRRDSQDPAAADAVARPRRSVAPGQRLPLAISVVALAVACTGVTPAEAVRAAKTAFASNAGKVNGIKASKTPAPNQLLPLGDDAKFPASVLPAAPSGPRGPRGAEGAKGDTGAQGSQGQTGPRGPSNVLTANRTNIPLGSAAGNNVELVAFDLPPGNWWILGTGSLVYEGTGAASYFRCSVAVGSQVGGQSTAYLGVGDDTNFPGATLGGGFAVQMGSGTEATQRVALRCRHDQPLSANPIAEHVSLTAIRAETVEIK